MTLLQHENQLTRTDDTSVAGDDYAKGSSYLLWAMIAAFVLVSVGITLFLMANRTPPVAVGEVSQVWAHAVHTLSTPVDAGGVIAPSEPFDQVLVFAQIRVRNQSDKPIVLKDLLTNLTIEDEIHSSYAATSTDYGRIFIAYPELSGLRGKPLLRDAVIDPGQVDEGMVVSSFHVTQEQWKTHKNLNFTVQLKYHPELTIVPTGPITEQ